MRESTARKQPPRIAPPTPMPRSRGNIIAGRRPRALTSAELVKLHHSLIESLDGQSGVIAQFVAPEVDASLRDVVYDLAWFSAEWLGKRVLFVDGTAMESRPPARRGEPVIDAGDYTMGEGATIHRVVGLDLYQMTFPNLRGALDMAPDVKHVPEFVRRARESFELVLIAAPAAAEAPMAMLLSRFVDGNILVLRSGHTRVPVAEELIDSLRTAGGTVAGVVLTHCQSFVPRFLRRWI
jgi:hypothetical protein